MSLYKRYYKNILSLIILIAGLIYLFTTSQAQHLTQMDWKVGTALVLLHGVFYFLVTIPQYYILKKINVSISLGRIFSLSIMTNFLNLLLPARGGVLLRGVVLNKNYLLKKRDYAAFSIFISLVGLFVLGLMGLILFPFMDWDGEKPIWVLQGGSLFLMLLGFYGLYFTKALTKWSKKIAELYHEKTQWKLINKKENFIVTSLFYCGSLLAYALRIYLLSQYFYLEIDVFDACALTVLLLLINTVPLLPGNLGVKEASVSGILSLMGYSAQIGFFMAVVDRLMQLIFLGILGVIFSFKWNIWAEWGKASEGDGLNR